MERDKSSISPDLQLVSIGHPTESDARLLGVLHNKVWRRAFRGLAPRAAFEALDQDHRISYWQRILDAAGCKRTLVATVQGRPIGMVTYGKARHPDFGNLPELQHLYVDPDFQSRGLGRRLLLDAVSMIENEGLPGVALGVVEENVRARSFYGSLGARERGIFTDPGPLWKSTNVLVELPSASVISGRLASGFEGEEL